MAITFCKSFTRCTIAASVIALSVLVAGCSDAAGPENSARVSILLTDAPADYLESAVVCISEVYLQGGTEDDAGRTVLWEADEEPQCFDLLELQGVTASLTEDEEGVDVPAGTYAQLRLIVESARVVLVEGYTFSDGVTTEMDLTVPSGSQTGIKVLLLEPVLAEPDTRTEITVDADVESNFHIQGNPETPAGINGVLFTPVLVEVDREEA